MPVCKVTRFTCFIRAAGAVCLASLLLIGCAGEAPESTPPSCTGASCTCPKGASCGFTESSCGMGSCSLDCIDHNECTGTCQESCSIDCANMSTCTVTVGPSGSVTCAGGSTCHITCTGQCSVSCAGDSTCDLKCAGDATSQAIPSGGQCT